MDLAELNAEDENIVLVGPSPLKSSVKAVILHSTCVEKLVCETELVHAPPSPAPPKPEDFDGCVSHRVPQSWLHALRPPR